jgi:hypothetical protein
MAEYKDHITSLKSTINHLKIEFEHFQNAGKNIPTSVPSSVKDTSSEQKMAEKNEAPLKEIMLCSNEHITFDIFTPNEEFGRNMGQKASFVALKENYIKGNKNVHTKSKDQISKSKTNKVTPSHKKYFKFQNSMDNMAGMSFGKNEESFVEHKTKGSPSTRVDTLNNTLRDVTNLSKSAHGESMKLNQYKQLSQSENFSSIFKTNENK